MVLIKLGSMEEAASGSLMGEWRKVKEHGGHVFYCK